MRLLKLLPPQGLVAIILLITSWVSNLEAQCDPCSFNFSTTLDNDVLTPYCDDLDLDVSIFNGINPCDMDARIEISIGSYTDIGFSEQQNFQILSSDADYVGEDTWGDGTFSYRRFIFDVDDIPAFEADYLRHFLFDFIADNNNSPYGTYKLHIWVYPLPENTCDVNGWSPQTYDLAIQPDDLYHRVITGKVSDLIASNDLNSNSCTLPLGNSRIIEDYLELDEDHCFIGGSGSPISLYLLPGARIIVKSGKTLTLNWVNIFTCDQLGEGIIVETGGKLIAEHVNFNDARFAVNAQPASTLDIRNCNFTNNYIGLNLDMTGASSGQEKVTFLGFSGNTFSTGSGQSLKAAYSGMPEAVESRGYCGIRLVNYRDFNVFGSNTFLRLANGIVAAGSNLNVGNLSFTDMHHGGAISAYPQEGYGVYLSSRNNSSWANIGLRWAPMTFENCKTGVFADRYAGKVENCTMTDVNAGVDWQKSQTRDVTIQYNDITANKYGIRSFLNEPTHNTSAIRTNEVTIVEQGDAVDPVTGIQLNELTGGSIGSGWTVTLNDVTMEDGGWGILYRNGNYGNVGGNTIMNEDPEAGNYIGLKIEGSSNTAVSANTIDGGDAEGVSKCILSSSGWANTFQCNCVDNSDIGIEFLDLADFQNAVRGNHFYNHCYGLQLGADGIDMAYIGLQAFQGNLWELGDIGCTYGAKNFSNPLKSKFFVNGTANTKCNPPVTPTSEWFTNSTKSANYTGCSDCEFTEAPPRVSETATPTEIDHAIVKDSMPYTTDEMIWKGRYRLYRKILRWPALESVSPYGAFKTAQSSLSTGKLAYIAEQRARLFVPDSLQNVSINSYRTTFLQKMGDIRTQDSLRQAGASINGTTYATLVSQRNTAASQLEAIYYTLDTARYSKLVALSTLNSAVTTSYACDGNHKAVNAIIFHLLLTDTLATGDLATLEGIAEQCPLEGGDAVYEARAFVRHLTGTEYDDLDLCSTASRSAQKPDKQVTSFEGSFYPNPTTGKLSWDNAAGEQVTIEVYDLFGRLRLSRNTSDPFIDLRPLSDGTYWIRLYPEVGNPIIQQVILVKE